ncbi:hypothetical protein HXA31_00160 [Salipaludibacillus agaradhaerens]|uniref:DUF4352 domain-containing protein n=1 Tax=Salipaludibacillus agaradhaerens TaxID=76935 RepID=A0A9Q4FZS5_SALAG|nr:hypothetical protein [Salipaludibacillus agaradhaerens]MCR6097741.1 hypothetical protein [Salipaludibacillus agaradhaerens]MCR6112775.1 hypothetical protein [Salipaludibacillus agaradhaerens]
MKKMLVGVSLSTFLIVAACGVGNEGADGDNNVNNEVENEQNNVNDGNEAENAADEIAEGAWETEVGETVETEAGTFTLHARADDIETIETGPIVMEIEQLNAQSGELSDEMAEILDTEELHMIQLDLTVENTADEDIMFYSGQATISTSTGEQLESDMWLSDYIDGEMMAGTKANGTFFFVLENSDAADVESVRLTWNAPLDEDWENVGEDVDIKVAF